VKFVRLIGRISVPGEDHENSRANSDKEHSQFRVKPVVLRPARCLLYCDESSVWIAALRHSPETLLDLRLGSVCSGRMYINPMAIIDRSPSVYYTGPQI